MPSVPEQWPEDFLAAERDILDRTRGMDLDLAAMAIISNIYRASIGVRLRIERQALAPDGLSFSAFVVLFVLWVWGDTDTADLARHVNVSKATISGVTRTLERRGLTERYVPTDDARRAVIRITESGTEVMDRVLPRFNAEEVAITAVLSPDERADLARLLRRIARSVRDLDEADADGQ